MGANGSEDLIPADTSSLWLYTGFTQQAGFPGLPCLAITVSENLHVCVIKGAPKVISAEIRVKELCGMTGKYEDIWESREIRSPLFFLTGNSGPHFLVAFMKNSKLYQALK